MARHRSCFIFRCTSKQYTAHVLLFVSLLFPLLPSLCSSQQLPTILLNSSAVGTTENAPTGLFTKFRTFDIRKPPVGLGGQRLFRFELPPQLTDTDITISTCEGSNFDTYLALLNGNPELEQDVIVLSESGNDINCETTRNKAFLSTKLTPGQYFILVTGNGDQEGNFTISVKGASATPPPVPWGLDRVDQRRLPLDEKYEVKPTGGRVWVYLIDSGVRTTHEEFEGRAQVGYDFVNNREASAPDCTGHGTHVAGIIAGKTYGVSKQARIVSVRAFDCNNTARVSAIVDALGWSLIDARFKERTNAVIAMMFSTTTFRSSTLQSAILGLQRSGIPIVIPAGNNDEDACGFYPGSLGTFLTVGSTGRDDARSQFSNFGNCTKIYAPGDSIVSSWHNSDKSWRSFSGTAQAAAHVVGVVSNLMNLNPRLKAATIYNIIESVSTLDVVENVAAGDSTRLAFVRSVPEFTGNAPPPKKEVYVFIVLRFKIFACSEETEEIRNIKNVFAGTLDVETSRVRLTCSTENDVGSSADSRLVELRFQLAERTAVANFVLLENMLLLGKTALEQRLGLPFDIVEEPWVVDSTMTVFWGAPTFSETESAGLSAGATAGLVVGVLFIVSVLAALSWVAYRRYAKLDVIESMEGSGDFNKGPVTFRDYDDTGESKIMRSFRNVVRAMNFKKSSARKSTVDDVEGMNRMGSFIGGPREGGGRDMVSVESFGGEAFAGLLSTLGEPSKELSRDSSGRKNSFHASPSLVLRPSTSTKRDVRIADFEDDDEELDESMRMRSLSGEAFAIIGLDSTDSIKRTGGVQQREGSSGIQNVDSYKAEALVNEADGEAGFFGV